MITLDQAIELMKAQVGELSGVTGVVLYADDILHYLKEYQRISARLEKIALGNITETLEKLDNPPLTWDELRTIEGKPVWVEEPYAENWHGEWKVVDMLYDSEYLEEDEKEFLTTDEERYHKTEQGKTWNAYRKERA